MPANALGALSVRLACARAIIGASAVAVARSVAAAVTSGTTRALTTSSYRRRRAARAAARQRLAPARAIGGQVQRREMARVLGEERAAQVDGIASRRMREIIEERLRRVRGVRTADRAPPEHRHPDLRRVEIHGDV